jgi:hypothetical protein
MLSGETAGVSESAKQHFPDHLYPDNDVGTVWVRIKRWMKFS